MDGWIFLPSLAEQGQPERRGASSAQCIVVDIVRLGITWHSTVVGIVRLGLGWYGMAPDTPSSVATGGRTCHCKQHPFVKLSEKNRTFSHVAANKNDSFWKRCIFQFVHTFTLWLTARMGYAAKDVLARRKRWEATKTIPDFTLFHHIKDQQ